MGATDKLVAGIELGGTKGIALVARGTEILEMARVPTTAPDETLARLGDVIAGWRAQHGQPAALGIASFGPVGLDRSRDDYGHITRTPKPGWSNSDVAGYFARRLGLPIAFDTDVNGAALAEYRWGAARGCDVAIYITIGTGVGGGLVVAGVPVHGLIHPEIGHFRVRRTGRSSFSGICPFHGDCVEGLISGPALAARTGIAGERIPADHPVWDEVASELGEAMATLLAVLSPQRIMIGGGVFQNRSDVLATVRRRTAAILRGYPAGVDETRLEAIIVPPGLGDRAGPLGAVALAYSILKSGGIT